MVLSCGVLAAPGPIVVQESCCTLLACVGESAKALSDFFQSVLLCKHRITHGRHPRHDRASWSEQLPDQALLSFPQDLSPTALLQVASLAAASAPKAESKHEAAHHHAGGAWRSLRGGCQGTALASERELVGCRRLGNAPAGLELEPRLSKSGRRRCVRRRRVAQGVAACMQRAPALTMSRCPLCCSGPGFMMPWLTSGTQVLVGLGLGVLQTTLSLLLDKHYHLPAQVRLSDACSGSPGALQP